MAFLAALNLYREWLTVSLLANAEPAFSEASLRYLIFQAKPRIASSGQQIAGNGLAPAIRKVGRKILINHGCERLDTLGLEYGVIMADDPRLDLWASVQVASIDTLRSRLSRLGDVPLMTPQLVIVDEAHLYVTKKRVEALNLWPTAYRLGLSATPARKDGRGLRLLFDDLLDVITVRELTEQGYLCPARYFSLSEPDLERVRVVANDYSLADLREVMAPLVADVVLTWLERAGGRRTVVFAVDIRHSAWLTHEFQAHGVAAEHVDANTPTAERDAIYRRFRSGETQVLCNCMLASYGFDLPDLSCVVLARPTRSLVLYLQMLGRGLRPAEGKTDCLVLDHSGAVLAHGFADQERYWTLDGHDDLADKRRQHTGTGSAPAMMKCPACMCVFTLRNNCPSCGHFFPPKAQKVKPLDGELIALTKPKKVSEMERKQFYLELRGYGEARDWKPGAAAHRYKGLYGTFPPWSWNSLPPAAPSLATTNWLKSQSIAYHYNPSP